jgi:hypothetical protein
MERPPASPGPFMQTRSSAFFGVEPAGTTHGFVNRLQHERRYSAATVPSAGGNRLEGLSASAKIWASVFANFVAVSCSVIGGPSLSPSKSIEITAA